MTTCIHDTTLITARGPDVLVLEHHSLIYDGPVISRIAPAAEVEAELARRPDVTRLDGRNHLTIPGLVNTHHHLFQSLTRGLKSVQDVGLFEWLTGLYPRWRGVTPEAVRAAAEVSIAELLLSGCTTTSDHFYLFPPGTGVQPENVIEAADRLGIRLHLCRGSMSLGRSGGGLPPDECVEKESDIVRDCLRVVDAWHDPGPLALRRIDLAPCSPFNVSAELLRDTVELARGRNLLLHTHAAETLDEERYCQERFGCRPLAYLAERGWLGPDVYLAHCVYLSAGEIADLARSGTGVAHCPTSNMRLGSGIAPLRSLLHAGVRTGLGVDGSSSNDGGHALAEARQAMLLQRVSGGAGAMTAAEAFRLATAGGAEVLNRPQLGRLEVGCAADLAMFRRDELALAGAVAHDPLGALLLTFPGRADRVVVHGRPVVSEGHLVGVDEHRLATEFNQLVRRMFHAAPSI